MTQDEIIEMLKEADLDFLLGDNWMLHHELLAFARLVAEKEYEKTSAWYRKLIVDIVEDVHKQHEKKKLRTRVNKAKGQA
jgi:hypothetical protein